MLVTPSSAQIVFPKPMPRARRSRGAGRMATDCIAMFPVTRATHKHLCIGLRANVAGRTYQPCRVCCNGLKAGTLWGAWRAASSVRWPVRLVPSGERAGRRPAAHSHGYGDATLC